MLLFDDVYFTPVSFNYLLESIKLLIENNISGIFNISSTERITKYDFGIIVCDYLNLNKKLLTKISINDLDLVQRPLNMSLSNLKLSNSLQVVIPNLHKQLNIYFDKYSYKN